VEAKTKKWNLRYLIGQRDAASDIEEAIGISSRNSVNHVELFYPLRTYLAKALFILSISLVEISLWYESSRAEPVVADLDELLRPRLWGFSFHHIKAIFMEAF